MSGELVERIMHDHGALIEYLSDKNEISFLSVMEATIPKVVLLAAASDLENQVQDIIMTANSFTIRPFDNSTIPISIGVTALLTRSSHFLGIASKRRRKQLSGPMRSSLDL